MAATFDLAGTPDETNSESSDTVTPALPSTTAGQLAICYALMRSESADLTISAGWTAIDQQGAGAATIAAWYRWLTGGDGNPTVTGPTIARSLSAFCVTVDGAVGSGDPMNQTHAYQAAGGPSGPPYLMTSPTTSNTDADGCLILRLYVTNDATNTLGNASEGTIQVNDSNAGGAGGAAYALTSFEQSSAGAVNAATLEQTANGPDTHHMFTFAIAPGAGGGASVGRVPTILQNYRNMGFG